jgi:hypothetical protein
MTSPRWTGGVVCPFDARERRTFRSRASGLGTPAAGICRPGIALDSFRPVGMQTHSSTAS